MGNSSSVETFDLRQFQCGVNYAIEASAGTGKTFNITEIVKKLVCEHRIDLSKILLVTYTEKAAGELKNRIREGLTSPLDELKGKSIAETVGKEVDCDVDNAFIGTIHAFCKASIEEFAVSAGKPTGLELTTDSTITDFANEYIRKGRIADEISSLMAAGKEVKCETLVEKLCAAAQAYYLDKDFKEDPSVIVYKQSCSDQQIKDVLALPGLLQSADFPSFLQKERPDLYREYSKLLNTGNPFVEDALAALVSFPSFFVDERGISAFSLTQGNGVGAETKKAFRDLLKFRDFLRDFKPENYLVDRYLKDFYEEFQTYKEKNRLQSFNDMIRVVRELVVGPDGRFLEKLRGKYRYGIIDEFQDTNQIQFDIFSKIFLCEGHNIIVVGDPKQSIYRFQGADVNVYKKAVEVIEKSGIKRRLDKNWRSSVGVVEFGNKLFYTYHFNPPFERSDPCLEKERRATFRGRYISGAWFNQEPLSPTDYAYFAVEQILECVSKGENGETNLRLSCIGKEGEMYYRDCEFRDFAVLARSKSEMREIQNALTRVGIPFQKYKDDSLFHGLECSHWIAVLEAIDAPDFTGFNRAYFKKALFTRFFDVPLPGLPDEKYDSDDCPQMDLFAKWKALAAKRLWQDLFDSVIADTGIESRMSSLSKRQSLSTFKQIANYALDFLGDGNDLPSLIAKLRILRNGSDDDENAADASLVARSTEFSCVTIMTMHASKGLQFPVVISVSGFKGIKSQEKTYSFHRQVDGGGLQAFVTLNKELAKSGIDDESEIEKEQKDELFRLFYVAFTRPEYLLIAPVYLGNAKGKKPQGIDSIIETNEKFLTAHASDTFDVAGTKIPCFERKAYRNLSLDDLRKKAKAALADSTQTDESKEEAEQKAVLKKLIREKGSKAAYKHSYSSLAHPNKEKEEDEILDDLTISDLEGDKEEQAVIVDESAKQVLGVYDPSALPLAIPEGYPKGAAMGNAIHEVFERLDFTDYENSLEPIILDRFALAGFDLSAHPDWLAYTKGIVTRTLDAVLPKVKGNAVINGTFRLSEIKDEDKKPEIEFNFNYPGQALKDYLTGFIDLLFRQGDVYCVLDWKSDTLSDEFLSYGDKDSLKGQVDRRYSIQRVLYCYCLIKWLKQHYGGSEEEVFASHFGGIYYVFVRGCAKDTSNGIYVQTWDSWADLEKEFLKIVGEGKE